MFYHVCSSPVWKADAVSFRHRGHRETADTGSNILRQVHIISLGSGPSTFLGNLILCVCFCVCECAARARACVCVHVCVGEGCCLSV